VQPTWLVDILAGVMLATSTYCVARLVVARSWGRALHQDVNLAHMADGVAMAGMLDATFRTLPNGVWEIVFGTMTVWFASRGARFVVRRGVGGVDDDHVHHVTHYLSHLVMSGGMLYMFVETSAPAAGSAARSGAMSVMGSAGAGASSLALLALLFVLVLFASAVWHADSLTRFTTTRTAPVGALLPVTAGTAMPAPAAIELERLDAEVWPDQVPTTEDTDADQARWLAPRLEMACHIAVCITMGYTLVLTL